MNAYKERFDVLEQRMRDRGVVDFKFHIDWSQNPSKEEISEDLITMLEAILDGETTPYIPKDLSFISDDAVDHLVTG